MITHLNSFQFSVLGLSSLFYSAKNPKTPKFAFIFVGVVFGFLRRFSFTGPLRSVCYKRELVGRQAGAVVTTLVQHHFFYGYSALVIVL